jgi:hypothetical protein
MLRQILETIPNTKFLKTLSTWEHSCSVQTDLEKLTARKNRYNNVQKLNLHVTVTTPHKYMLGKVYYQYFTYVVHLLHDNK